MKFIAALLLAPAFSYATTAFDGYEAYHASLPDRMFLSPGIELNPYFIAGDEQIRFGWQGIAAGRQQRIEVRGGKLRLNGRPLRSNQVHPFPGEGIAPSDFGLGATVYFSAGWTCIENTPTSASGTAVRHKAVYLIKQAQQHHEAWKLPSLFASCTGIRMRNKLIHVDAASYRYEAGNDLPAGVLFTEHVICGARFSPTGHSVSTKFTEPENVYKFSLLPD